jgi:hypothetical protein
MMIRASLSGSFSDMTRRASRRVRLLGDVAHLELVGEAAPGVEVLRVAALAVLAVLALLGADADVDVRAPLEQGGHVLLGGALRGLWGLLGLGLLSCVGSATAVLITGLLRCTYDNAPGCAEAL